MYSTLIAYLLWCLSFFGACGFHRFYLGKIPSGLLWMFTGGLLGIGSIYDLITIPRQVQEANIRKALYGRQERHFRPAEQPDNWRYADDAQFKVVSNDRKKETPERVILKVARENKGILTVSELALAAEIPIEQAKKYLEALVSKGFAELRVKANGSLVYVILDLAGKDEPLEDF